MHNLSIHEARFRKFRPIHLLTHVGQHHRETVKKGDAFWLGLTLENKLFAVTHYSTLLCETITPLSVNLYEGHYIRDMNQNNELLLS